MLIIEALSRNVRNHSMIQCHTKVHLLKYLHTALTVKAAVNNDKNAVNCLIPLGVVTE
jgi:hypothetical protein